MDNNAAPNHDHGRSANSLRDNVRNSGNDENKCTSQLRSWTPQLNFHACPGKGRHRCVGFTINADHAIINSIVLPIRRLANTMRIQKLALGTPPKESP